MRRTTLKGGAYLAVREMVGMGIRFLGVVIVTRQIGPHAFGTYSGAAAFIAVAVLLSQMGMEIYLIRQPKEPSKRDYDEVFTFIAALSAIVVLAFLGLSVLYVHIRPSAGSSINVFRLLLISVPLNALWAPAQARIERSFGFRNMAILELGGDVTLYLVAASLALFGWGAYSLVVAVIAWQAWILVGSYRMARMFPRLRLPNRHWRNFMKHGAAYSSSSVGGMFAIFDQPDRGRQILRCDRCRLRGLGFPPCGHRCICAARNLATRVGRSLQGAVGPGKNSAGNRGGHGSPGPDGEHPHVCRCCHWSVSYPVDLRSLMAPGLGCVCPAGGRFDPQRTVDCPDGSSVFTSAESTSCIGFVIESRPPVRLCLGACPHDGNQWIWRCHDHRNSWLDRSLCPGQEDPGLQLPPPTALARHFCSGDVLSFGSHAGRSCLLLPLTLVAVRHCVTSSSVTSG